MSVGLSIIPKADFWYPSTVVVVPCLLVLKGVWFTVRYLVEQL